MASSSMICLATPLVRGTVYGQQSHSTHTHTLLVLEAQPSVLRQLPILLSSSLKAITGGMLRSYLLDTSFLSAITEKITGRPKDTCPGLPETDEVSNGRAKLHMGNARMDIINSEIGCKSRLRAEDGATRLSSFIGLSWRAREFVEGAHVKPRSAARCCLRKFLTVHVESQNEGRCFTVSSIFTVGRSLVESMRKRRGALVEKARKFMNACEILGSEQPGAIGPSETPSSWG